MTPSSTASLHFWQFFRAGGLDQVKLQTGADLAALRQLDPKLWVALACPTQGLEFDSRTLDLIDSDKDGRVRVPEILAAIDWALARLENSNDLVAGGAALPLAAIAANRPEGQAILAAARQILTALGRPEATAITVSDAADTSRFLAQTRFNGDGIIPAESAPDASTQRIIGEIAAAMGTRPDRCGLPGIDQAATDRFFGELAALSDWWTKADLSSGAPTGIMFLGDRTPAAFSALQAVRAKIDDYFNRCRLAAFDPRALDHLNGTDTTLAALAALDFSTLGAGIAALPLAHIAPARPLPLTADINPAWTPALAQFRTGVVTAVLGAGKHSINEAEWDELQYRFAAHAAWLATKPATAVEALGPDRIRAILLSGAREAITKLIARDLSLAADLAALESVERLARYYRDLPRLLANFVNFADFYDPARPAIFQAGTLYLDSRHCELCVQVSDAGAHAALATMSKCYIAYCDLRRPGEAMKIAAVFSNGDNDFLMVGRNGLFVDRQGRDWDATVTKVIDNPISIRQAFWSPYKKFLRLVEEQVAKRAATADSAADAKLAAAASATAHADKGSPSKPAEPKKFDLALVTGIGVALGSIGAMLAAVFAKVVDLAWWQYPLVLVGLFLLISLPSMLIAWLKLRQRTLGPVLEANGWAINGRVRINIPLGTTFTALAKLPPNSRRSLEDPFEDKAAARARRRFVALLALAVVLGGVLWVRIDHNRRGGIYFGETPSAPVPGQPAAPAASPTPAAPATAAPPAAAAAPAAK
jgi:hypothetical protein